MQAVFYHREKPQRGEVDDSKTESKVLTRKQNRGGKLNKREGDVRPHRKQRSHSTQEIRFVKHQITNDQRNQQKEQQAAEGGEGGAGEEGLKSPKERIGWGRDGKKKKLVFNKFSRQEKEEVREWLREVRASGVRGEIVEQFQDYISKIEDNNSKLLEVNYFFQKELNALMAEKRNRSGEKCNRAYCMECRYHLQKQNAWKKERQHLLQEIKTLKEEEDDEEEEENRRCGGGEDGPGEEERRLREQIGVKNEQYLILLKQFTYLDGLNRELKANLSRLMEQYKYLSIENRSLLNTKTRLLEKELECTKYKDERDYFKKKVIEHHIKKDTTPFQPSSQLCRCGQSRDYEIFELSEVSNDGCKVQEAKPNEMGKVGKDPNEGPN